MRPYIPPSVYASDMPGLAGEGSSLLRAEEIGRAKGRHEGAAEGREAGLAEGVAAARAEMAPRLAALEGELTRLRTENAFAETLQTLLASRVADRTAADAACGAAIGAALRLLFPTLAESAQGAEVAALLRSALLDRPADILQVRAHPDTLARMRAALPADADPARMRLMPEPARAPGGAEISWQVGGFSYDPDRLLAQIGATLSPSDPVCEIPEQDSAA